MVRTIVQCRLDVNHWIASDNTTGQSILNTLLDCCTIFLRNNTTLDFVNEFKDFFAVFWKWFKSNPNITILTTTTRLLSMLTLRFGHTANRLAVGNLWLTDVCFDVKFSLHAIN